MREFARQLTQPSVHADQITIAATITLTGSIDHRAHRPQGPSTTGPIDGAIAAGFLTCVLELTEQPLGIAIQH